MKFKKAKEEDFAAIQVFYWDVITVMVILISMAISIYFGDWIKTVLPVNLLFFLLLVQVIYVGIRWYVKGWRETRGYY